MIYFWIPLGVLILVIILRGLFPSKSHGHTTRQVGKGAFNLAKGIEVGRVFVSIGSLLGRGLEAVLPFEDYEDDEEYSYEEEYDYYNEHRPPAVEKKENGHMAGNPAPIVREAFERTTTRTEEIADIRYHENCEGLVLGDTAWGHWVRFTIEPYTDENSGETYLLVHSPELVPFENGLGWQEGQK